MCFFSSRFGPLSHLLLDQEPGSRIRASFPEYPCHPAIVPCTFMNVRTVGTAKLVHSLGCPIGLRPEQTLCRRVKAVGVLCPMFTLSHLCPFHCLGEWGGWSVTPSISVTWGEVALSVEPFLNLVWRFIGLVGSCHLLLQNFWKGWVLSGHFDSLWEAPVTLSLFGAKDLCFSTFSLYQMAFHCQQMILLLFMYWGLSLEVFILFILLDLHSLIL